MSLLHVGPDELDAQLQLRRRRCRRVNAWNTNIELVGVELDRDVAQPQFRIGADVLGFVTQLNIHGRHGYGQFRLDDAGLAELANVITTYLQLPAPPIEVQVTLQQPRRRRKKAPPASVEQLTEVQLIKRRMMEGR